MPGLGRGEGTSAGRARAKSRLVEGRGLGLFFYLPCAPLSLSAPVFVGFVLHFCQRARYVNSHVQIQRI